MLFSCRMDCNCDSIENGYITVNNYNLTVSNTIFTSNLYASGNIYAAYFNGDGSGISNINTSNIVQPFANLVVSNSVTTTHVFTTGNVGIGTFTPGAMLDVVTNAPAEVGSLIAQFGSGITSRIKIYDENAGAGLPPYITGEAGNGLGLACPTGPIIFYTNGPTPGNEVMRIQNSKVGINNQGPAYSLDIIGNAQLYDSSFGGNQVLLNIAHPKDNFHNIINTGDGSYGPLYAFTVFDNISTGYTASPLPQTMINFSRLENNGDGNFHVEFVNVSQNGGDHNDYGVGFGFFDNGQAGSSIGRSPFLISAHQNYDTNTNGTTSSNAVSNVAISIGLDGRNNVGINTIVPYGNPSSYGQLQVATYSNSNDQYTLQVYDNGNPDQGSAYAMAVFTRTESASLVGPNNYHMEFINKNPIGPDYGVGFGFSLNGGGQGQQPFILSAHCSGAFNNTVTAGSEVFGSVVLATDGTGHVGICGQLNPGYPLDVNGTINASDSVITTNVFTSNIVDSKSSFGLPQQLLSQSGTGIQWTTPAITRTVVRVTSGTYNVLDTDYYIGCNGVGIIIQLPSSFLGKQYVIKDESGQALVNPVTILPSGTSLIDNNTSVSLFTNYMSLTLLFVGSFWSVI